MSMIRDFVEGVAAGFASATSERTSSANPAVAIVERCCRNLVWTIDERPSASQMVLHFNDPLIGTRKLHPVSATRDFTWVSGSSVPSLFRWSACLTSFWRTS